MVNKELLESTIQSKGYKIGFIASELGLSRMGLYKKINGRSEFVASEIQKLCKLLGLNDREMKRIFFN